VSLAVSDGARSVVVITDFIKNLNCLNYGSAFIVQINSITQNRTTNHVGIL